MGSYTSSVTSIPADAVEPLGRLHRLQDLAYDGLVEGEWDEITLGPDPVEGEPGYAVSVTAHAAGVAVLLRYAAEALGLPAALMLLARTVGKEHSTTGDPYAVRWRSNDDGVRGSLYLAAGEERCEIHASGHGAEDERRSYAVIGYCRYRDIPCEAV